MREAVWSIAAGLAGVVLCGLNPAGAGASSSSAMEPVPLAQARVPRERIRAAAPPVLLARTVVPTTPMVAVRPVPAPALVAQGNIVRVVTPNSSQPNVLWLIAMGAVLYRVGARVVRV